MKSPYMLEVAWHCACMGFRESICQYWILLGGLLLYISLLVAYSGVFHAFPMDLLKSYGFSYGQLIIYLAVTEFILYFSSSYFFRELWQSMQDARTHSTLLYPCGLATIILGKWVGRSTAIFSMLIVPCLSFAFWLSEKEVSAHFEILYTIIHIALACGILLCAYFIIGVSCLWFRHAEAVFFLWQNLMLLLGAYMYPLSLYPTPLQQLVWLTPFPAILWVSGQQLSSESGIVFCVYGSLYQCVWLALFIFLVNILDKAALKRIQAGK